MYKYWLLILLHIFFLQTFAIPGSIFLSILSGFLYPFPLALFLVCLCSGLGASFCYMLSYLVGRPVVYKYLTEKAVKWSQQVERHREHLINYIIFLRITPFLPNWFINITSPVINVPLKVFFYWHFSRCCTSFFCSNQGRNNSASAYNSRGGCFLELGIYSDGFGPSFYPASHLPKTTKAEV